MSTIQVLEEKLLERKNKQLTFEELCPKWSEQVRSGVGSKLITGLSHNHERCIVGEAWKFNAGYSCNNTGCSECRELSGELVRAPPLNSAYDDGGIYPPAIAVDYKSKTIRSINYERYEFFKNRFMKHWNDIHVR